MNFTFNSSIVSLSKWRVDSAIAEWISAKSPADISVTSSVSDVFGFSDFTGKLSMCESSFDFALTDVCSVLIGCIFWTGLRIYLQMKITIKEY